MDEHPRVTQKLHYSLMSGDMTQLDFAREMLQVLEQNELLQLEVTVANSDIWPKTPISELDEECPSAVIEEEEEAKAEEEVSSEETEVCSDMYLDEHVDPEKVWEGSFEGFDTLDEVDQCSLSENKKCLELSFTENSEKIASFLKAGIRCFMIDLFYGTSKENQMLIVRLRECEYKVSKLYGFPVTTTLFAKLSPRFQYTGAMENRDAIYKLKKGEEIMITANRFYSTRCTGHRIYVNAQFLISTIELCDIILIGPDLQVQVQKIYADRLRCIVLEPGAVGSLMPVLFPRKCNKYRVSKEEIEDITFSKETGINVIVSNFIGTQSYFENLRKTLELLNLTDMRLCARVVLNDIKGCDCEVNWAAESYDGFLIELYPENNGHDLEIMHICPAAEDFIKLCYDLRKPIIFDPSAIANRRVIISPDHYMHIYFYPDRYVFKGGNLNGSFYFYNLQMALFAPLPEQELSKQPFCDISHTGSDSLARSCVSAAFEMHATAIFVVAPVSRMAIKISHFRPNVPVIFITTLRSAGNYVSLYHNIIMLHFRSNIGFDSTLRVHRRSILRQLLFGCMFAKSQKVIQHGENVMFVYSHQPGDTFSDKFVAYKFHEDNFPGQLAAMLMM